ncbi:MAG: hypothetical protein JXA30_14295 [Deltaproteobacteria bacterium]|nr:hypothetical protein [Deltaproteobacteria bacterium]
MSESQFDPNLFFQFDLERGEVRARDGSRVLLLSQDVLGPLIGTAVRSGDLTAVRELGNQLGSYVKGHLGESVEDKSPAIVLGNVADVLALYGWGRLRVEQWGNALVLQVEKLPPLDQENLAVAALLGGALSTLCSREVACVPVGSDNRYLVVDPNIAERVWAWFKGGNDIASIVSKLVAPEGS